MLNFSQAPSSTSPGSHLDDLARSFRPKCIRTLRKTETYSLHPDPVEWVSSFLVGLVFKLSLQSGCSITWATPPVHFALVILEMRVLWTICLGWPQTVIFLNTASQVARISAMSSQCLVGWAFWFSPLQYPDCPKTPPPTCNVRTHLWKHIVNMGCEQQRFSKWVKK
jgi:hypothetical protein